MTDDLEARFRALVEKLGAPAPLAVPSAGVEHDADLQAAATAQADALLRRIAALAETLQGRAGGWDLMDEAAARLLLSDLAILTGWWRGLGDLASARLDAAASELQEAAHASERTLKPRLIDATNDD